jgi:hypothetical protein
MIAASNKSDHLSFSGIWKSRYAYPGRSKGKELKSEHFVRAHQVNDHIVFASMPGTGASYVVVRLYFDGAVGTGSWQEETDPDGHYKGAVYHGAIQVVASKDRKQLTGKWVGFGKDMQINTGPWEFEYYGEDLPPDLAES